MLRRSEFVNQLNTLSAGFGQLGVIFFFEIAKLYSWQAYDWNANQGKKAGLQESRVSMFATLAPEFKATIVIVFVSTRISLLIPVMAM